MTISNQTKYAGIDDFLLDNQNPRLGRQMIEENLSQEDVLEIMKDWTLDELAVSFMESGFWAHEALLVIEEKRKDGPKFVVVEGNRRLAALKILKDTVDGRNTTRKWIDIAESNAVPKGLFDSIPYIKVDSRDEIEAFLGFRHVTGIKQWKPSEKAQYICRLIDDGGLSYQQVMRKIGSKTDTVRRNYISYRILMQMEQLDEKISLEHVEDKFSVLFLSLRESGVRKFLDIKITAGPTVNLQPVPPKKLENLVDFATWLFGSKDKLPLFIDSRNITKFGKVLESSDAIDYLRSTARPDFDLAIQKARADEPELIARLGDATDEIEIVLGRVHLCLNSEPLRKVMDRFARGAFELIKKFPDIAQKLFPNWKK